MLIIIGPTPIVPVFRRVLRDKQNEIAERKLLILLATDGVPTDNQGHRDIRSFEYVLKQERKPTDRIPVTIIACTGIKKIYLMIKNESLLCHFSC